MRLPLTLLLALQSLSWAAAPGQNAGGARPSFKKVVIVVFENTGETDALAQPFFARLAKEGARLSEYYAVDHPSQPNYIAMVAGDTLGVSSDRTVTLEQSSLADLLEAANKSWKIYAEDYPGRCFLRATSGKYARKHAPFLSFKSIQDDAARCARVVNASEFAADARSGRLPDYSLYIPNLDNDGHDTGVEYADRWFGANFGPLLDEPAFARGTLLVATFDEDDGGDANHVLTILHGDSVAAGVVSANRYDHYSLLRTVEDGLGLKTLGRRDASAKAFVGVWK